MRIATRRAARVAIGIALALGSAADASTPIEGDLEGGTGGVTYAWQLALDDAFDVASVPGNVGSKSWADPSNPGLGSFGLNAGWTHTSNWIYLDLAEDSLVRITLAANADVPNTTGGFYAGDLVPAMSLWTGYDDDGGDDHFFEQGQVPHWIDAAGFAFVDHDTTGPGPFAGEVATIEIALDAGVYTINAGGHDDTTSGHRAGYLFTVQGLPEPGVTFSAALAVAALAALRARRR